jgi:hypothetical protein
MVQFRAVGWTSKRPTNIQTEWTYTSPKGVNMLIDERAVVEYASQSGLLAEDEDNSAEAVENEDNSAEAVEDGGNEHVHERD